MVPTCGHLELFPRAKHMGPPRKAGVMSPFAHMRATYDFLFVLSTGDPEEGTRFVATLLTCCF